VNILPQVKSLFWWHGTINSAEENLLIVKTKTPLLNEVIRLVKENHSYEIPQIIALPIIGGNQDYLSWIEREVG
jgi:periplasmic divalent cation tolerance protein